ncbi:MAG TPA: Na+/H+ antiporter NhaA [Candidatus Limnocylindria bacterium]
MSAATAADYRGESQGAPRLATIREFLTTEAGGALILLAATIVALVWANSGWRDGYTALWGTQIGVTVGDYSLSHDLGHWVNDGLMTLFFLLVGLEIRREFDMGEFRERRRIAVPVIAAVGGMVLPVVIFLAFNAGTDGARGWAMVMATDTAFAVGVLALVGRRSSMRLRVLLLTLVIVDDVAAVSVIAVFYSNDLHAGALLAGLALLAAMALLRWRGVERSWAYVLLSLLIWLAASEAGVHPTVAGVAIGMLTGAHPPRRERLQEATGMTRAFRQQPSPALARAAAARITLSLSPNDRLQHGLHPWTSYLVVPIFALANGGVDLSGNLFDRVLGSPLVIGIVLGLVLGKTLGITGGAWLATRSWLGGLSLSVGWPSLVAASSVAGIGFTVSLLIADLSYAGDLLEDAKLGILTASLAAGVLSIVLFHAVSLLPRDLLRRAEGRAARPLADLVEAVDPTEDHVRGTADASITLVEYGDYECPHCGRAAPIIIELLRRHAGDLRFVFRHLPLTDVHPNAALAAEAAEAAAAQGRFWEMHDALFARQDALQLPDLVDRARDLGLDVPAFERGLRSGRFAADVARDVSSAEASGVVGTPTFFINEVRYRGSYDLDSLDGAVVRAATAASNRALAAADDEPMPVEGEPEAD